MKIYLELVKMFNEFTLNSSCEQKQELPTVLRIGNFLRGNANIPVLMPIDVMNGLCFETNSKTQERVLQQMQYIALDLIKQVSPEILSLTFVDLGLNTNFPILHSLNLSNINFISSRDNLKGELDKLYNHAHYISTRCLNAYYTNLKEYNQNTTYKESFHFLFIANFPKDYKEDEINTISEIVNEGARCGIQVIMNLDRRYFPDYNSYNKNHYIKLCNLLDEITLIDTTKEIAELRNFNVRTIQNWFAKYTFNFDKYSTAEIKGLVDNLHHASNTQDNQSENFLSIPNWSIRERASLF